MRAYYQPRREPLDRLERELGTQQAAGVTITVLAGSVGGGLAYSADLENAVLYGFAAAVAGGVVSFYHDPM